MLCKYSVGGTVGKQKPRIIIFSGKGGVGKTTAAAATALRCAQQGLKTIVISIDIALACPTPFNSMPTFTTTIVGNRDRYTKTSGRRKWTSRKSLIGIGVRSPNIWPRSWGASGMTDVLAEELAIIPGMEDVVSLLYINQYYRERTFDVIVIDCAPTGESLRFISMPSTLEWYMKKIFKLERSLLKVARPVAKRLTDVPLPEDSYFASMQDLFLRLEGVDEVLLDREVTSVRLVTNAEKMVVRETQRAFMYFCLFGLVVDAVIVKQTVSRDFAGPILQGLALHPAKEPGSDTHHLRSYPYSEGQHTA